MYTTLAARRGRDHLDSASINDNEVEIALKKVTITQDIPTEPSLPQTELFLEVLDLDTPMVLDSAYNSFYSEPLHNRHLDISKLTKERKFMFLGSDSNLTSAGGDVESFQALSQMQMPILRGCISMQTAIERDTDVSVFHVDVWQKEMLIFIGWVFCH